MYHYRKILLFLLIPVSGLFPGSRHLVFSDPDINSDNEILVMADLPPVEGGVYRTLLRGRADLLTREPLTLYPLRSGYFPRRQELRVYNHYGVFRYSADAGSWEESEVLPSFRAGTPASPMALRPLYDSPDGRYAVCLREEEGVRVSLSLYDYDSGKSLPVSGFLPGDYSSDLVRWAPDSRYFIYRRDRELYYFSVDQYLSGRIPAEEFRRIGHRDMNSVCWGRGNYLYMISGQLVFRLHSSEFFTRSFYADPFQKGSVWGRLPVAFDPNFDRFSLNPSAESIFLIKDDSNGFVFPLGNESAAVSGIRQLSSFNLDYRSRIGRSEWLDNSNLAVFVENPEEGGKLYQFTGSGGGAGEFRLLSPNPLNGYTVSPDGHQVALFRDDRVEVVDRHLHETVHTYPVTQPRAVYWTDEGFYIAGARLIYDIRSDESRIIGIGQAETAGFTSENEIVCGSDGRQFLLKDGLMWEPAEEPSVRPARQSSFDYRIYLEHRPGGWYESNLKVRRVDGYSTSELFVPYGRESLPEALQPFQRTLTDVPWYFSHGNREGEKEVSIVINGIRSGEGLHRLLDIFEGYGIEAAFFLNGDFINNYPDRTRLISETDHTVGSLFYTWFDMSDPKYHIDRDFLKKGLARNEDDYFITTGEEMAMLWHAPNYHITRDILDSTGAMQYTYIGKDIDLPDRAGLYDGPEYRDAVALVESALKQILPGSVIPVTLGSQPGREDYVYLKLAMLIEGLIQEGYEIVPLARLMKNGR